jgi:hypothetical protein
MKGGIVTDGPMEAVAPLVRYLKFHVFCPAFGSRPVVAGSLLYGAPALPLTPKRVNFRAVLL